MAHPTTRANRYIRDATDRAADELLDLISHGAHEDQVYALWEEAVLDAFRAANDLLTGYGLDPRRVDEAQLQALYDRIIHGRSYDTEERLQALARHVSGGLRETSYWIAADFCFLRTEQMDIFRRAAILGYQANSDVVAGWQWEASLDDRTCCACIAMHGSEHPVDEVGPDGHPNCRCCAVPIIRGRDKFIDEDEGRRFFESLTEKQQADILGKKGLELYQGGKYPMDQWWQRKSNPVWRDYVTRTKVSDFYKR